MMQDDDDDDDDDNDDPMILNNRAKNHTLERTIVPWTVIFVVVFGRNLIRDKTRWRAFIKHNNFQM